MGTRVVGLDSAGKFGWVGIVVDADGYVGAHLGGIEEIVAAAGTVSVVGIDIPIGHVPGGVRRADQLARAFIGGRRSSVFSAPAVEVLSAATYAEANELLAAAGRPKMSRQAWGIVPKLVEAARVAETDDRLYEVHPEVSFRAMAGGPLAWSKKSWNGLQVRRRLLAEHGIALPDEIADVGAVADDVVDAAAVAWTAWRIATGDAVTLPNPPEFVDGRRVAIWY